MSYVCPVCRKESSKKQGVLQHFSMAVQGLGHDPEKHVKWAEDRQINSVKTLFGGPKDEDGLPAMNLVALKAKLYEVLDHQADYPN